MDKKRVRLFGSTKDVEMQFDSFLDTLSDGALSFRAGVTTYLATGADHSDFVGKQQQIIDLEHKGDELRRLIEHQLYTLALIPDFRGDVLSMLEDLDGLLNVMKENMVSIGIEAPNFPKELYSDVLQLAEDVGAAVESTILASRAFLRDVQSVRDHLHKVMFYEKEADKHADKLKRSIFASALPLAEKSHLRRFVDKIDQIADQAEDVADWLAIYTIKRSD
ncbi:conserved hypothetical protein [Candidatus Accumulibacter aalborgensis]|uniref:Phosphate transport regulator n=1 Tax=Candidatus Accumulibacter aalborgensis TaxID=1860102 RepID=A0A1A8XGJ7_9PROT|nr:DUF47 family protein [Candidatus Accumulibacter aalborgensis]SBT03058.1 conserved hypothetical protein [Candidatus Accumulibacter aalborgensis]